MSMKLTDYLGDKPFWKVTVRLAVPVALQNVLTSSFQLVDTLMVSRLGDVTLSAVGMAAQWGWMAQLASASRRSDLKQEPTFPEECLSYTEDELNERTTLRTDIDTYLTQSMANFIMGVWSLDSDWDTYLETLKTMRLEDYLAIEQAAWDRYIAE